MLVIFVLFAIVAIEIRKRLSINMCASLESFKEYYDVKFLYNLVNDVVESPSLIGELKFRIPVV